MSRGELPDEVLSLVHKHLASMDHVAILLALHSAPERQFTAASLAELARVTPVVAAIVLADLVAAWLIASGTGGFQFASGPGELAVVDQLADMYNTKPVTLVRAIYERPPSAARSFADAFRIRKSET